MGGDFPTSTFRNFPVYLLRIFSKNMVLSTHGKVEFYNNFKNYITALILVLGMFISSYIDLGGGGGGGSKFSNK